jgi:hypothetical protein
MAGLVLGCQLSTRIRLNGSRQRQRIGLGASEIPLAMRARGK